MHDYMPTQETDKIPRHTRTTPTNFLAMAKQRYVYIISCDGRIKEVHTRARIARERYSELRTDYANKLVPYEEGNDYGDYMIKYSEQLDKWRLERWPIGKPA